MSTRPSRLVSWPGASLMSVATLLFWMGCGGSDTSITEPPSTPPPGTPSVSQVTLSADSLFFGGLSLTRILSAQARADDGSVVTGATVAWQSANTGVATVSTGGSVTAVAPGSTTVTASSGSASASAKVVVEQVAAGLTVSPSNLTLDSLGALGTLTAARVDSGGVSISGDVSVAWSSADGAVAVVDLTGLVQAYGPGTTAITVTDSLGLSASAEVTVSIPALAGVVDESGGTITVPGGKATLTLTPGAVPYSVAFTAEDAQPSNTEDMVAGTAMTFGPDVTFAAPVDLAISYDPAGIPGGADQRSLGLYRLDGSSWAEVADMAVDTAAHKVVGRMTATGTFAIRANRRGNPTGLWLVTETTIFDSCYGETGLVEETSVYAEKNGDVLTVERDGETVSGTLVGDVFGWDESYLLEGVNVRERYSISVARTGLTATGQGHFVGSGAVSCEVRTELSAVRVGPDRPKSTAGVGSVSLSFVESPGATSRVWRPDVGDGVQILATARDKNGATMNNVEVVLSFTEGRVLSALPQATTTGNPVTLAPGLVGSTQIVGVAIGPDGARAESAPLTLSLVRDTTTLRLLAPPQGTGRFFDLAPLLVWEDDNAEAERWEVVAGSQRLPLRLRRSATGASRCAAGQRCVDRVTGLWGALGPAGDTPFVRLEGINALGNVVSRETFDFTHAARNSIDLASSTNTPIWSTLGNGFSPAGSSGLSKYPNTQALYCGDDELEECLHAYVQTQWTPKHQVLVVERRPQRGGAWQAARIWLPYKLLDGTVTQSPWDCTRDNGNTAYEDASFVSFRWLEGGQLRSASGSAESADPTPPACHGNITVSVEEYRDVRGTWRIYTVQGTGSMITPLGIQDVAFNVVGAVKWADGDIEPPRFWVEGRNP